MYKRLLNLCSVIIFIFMFLCYRVYVVQKDMELKESSPSIQKENISDVNTLILDSNGKDLLSYKKEYYLVLDRKPFRLNDPTMNLDNLLAFNYIMRNDNEDFSLGKLFEKTNKEYIKISKETYYKLQELPELKGVYTFVKDVVEGNEAWKIENVLSTFYNSVEKDGKIKNELKSLGTLERTLYDYTKENEKAKEEFVLGRDAVYASNNYDISKNNINIKTTLNSSWQEKIREVLNDPKYSELDNAGVVIIEADTGKIKSLVQKNEQEPNVILGGTYGYEPGSIFKLLTEEIGLEKGIVKETGKISCLGEYCNRNGKPYAHGAIDIQTALKVSCNEFFQKIGLEVTYNNLYEFAKEQGLFSKVLNLENERIGEADKNGGVTNFAIGQSFVTTPLQMAGIIGPIVNNGIYIKPYIIDSLVDQKGNTIKVFNSEETKKVISESTASKVKRDMKSVVGDGSGYNAKISGIDIGGKTGTANGAGDDYGSFLGYFNLGDKYYSMNVFVPGISGKNKDGEELVGGNTAAPIFKDVILTLSKK